MKKGFTLIELLVVIAIIGMLSSVIMSSLNNARAKSANAAVKANLNNLRAQAEIYYDGNSSTYTNICTNANIVKGADAASQAGANNTTSDVCNSTATAYAISAPLKVAEGTSNYWCIDNTGTARGHANALGAATVCP